MKTNKFIKLIPVLIGLSACGIDPMSQENTLKQLNNENIEIKASSSKDGFEISKANDGDFTSYWEANNSTNQSITLDLKEVKILTNITQVFNQDDIWYFKIEASIDNVKFFTLLDNSFGVYGQTFSEAISGYARYIKMTILKSEKGYIPSSKEFYVETKSLSEGVNLALGLKGDASSQQGNYLAKNAFDGDNGTFWCASSSTFPQWLSGEWSEGIYANNIELFMQDYGEYSFEVEVRLLDETWEKAQTQISKKFNYFKIDLNKEINAIVFRVYSGPGWANMAQIKVNGFENIKNLIGKKDVFVHSVETSDDEITVQTDGSKEKVNKNSIDKIVSNIEGLNDKDIVYGFDLDSLLNFNFTGKMNSYLDEDHYISAATDSIRNVDYKKTYYQAETLGETGVLTFDLGKECLIKSFEQEFIDSRNHQFVIETSLDGENYSVSFDNTKNSINSSAYTCELSDAIIARYVRLSIIPEANEYANSVRFNIFGNGSSKRESWWQDTSGVIRFYPKLQQSTLREIRSRLDEFRYSGYRVIELHQPYEGMADIWAGLGATNNYQVDPIIGNLNDLTDLLNEAHEKGIKVFMFGNVGYGKADSDLFRKAQRDKALGINSREANCFLWSDTCKDASKWFYSDIANCYYYGYWGEDGQIPTYNFANKEWQEECNKYIKYWAEYGFDGIALDAPDVYYYGSESASQITFKNITSTLRKNNLFSLPEGSGNTGFISNYHYSAVQNYNMTSWGSGALSLGLCAAQAHSANSVDDYVKSVRDTAVSLGGISIDGMNFEDNYDEASVSDRILESALVTTTGHMAFLHIGSSAKIGQDIMKTWDPEAQSGVAKSFALQNSLASLNASGERTKINTNNDSAYYAFFKANMNGNNKSLVLFNYLNSSARVTVDLNGTSLLKDQVNLYDAYNNEYIAFTPKNGKIEIEMKANSHRVFIAR